SRTDAPPPAGRRPRGQPPRRSREGSSSGVSLDSAASPWPLAQPLPSATARLHRDVPSAAGTPCGSRRFLWLHGPALLWRAGEVPPMTEAPSARGGGALLGAGAPAFGFIFASAVTT